MPDPGTTVGIAAAVVGVAGLGVFLLRPRPRQVDFASGREEELTRRLAGKLRCELAHALPPVRAELQIAPDQTDETILKRAEYHYRRNLPDTPCGVWRDRGAG
jgi:hypothetical protein